VKVRCLCQRPEEVLVSFASEPGRDDSNLPPANIVIPDDARELDRDVLAYHRELRARRRRQRLTRLAGPFGRREFGGPASILPLIAACVALSMLAGAMLSVITIGPALAPTVSQSAPAPRATELTVLPAGAVLIDGKTVALRSLMTSALALVPAGCDCGPSLLRLAGQAAAAHVRLYFVASAGTAAELQDLTARYGQGAAVAVYDTANVLGTAYHPVGLTVLLVRGDATVDVRRGLSPTFQLGPDLRQLAVLSRSSPGALARALRLAGGCRGRGPTRGL
jgi:hypothetical protein